MANGKKPEIPEYSAHASDGIPERELLRKLHRVVMHIPMAVIIATTDGTVEFVNPSFTTITGYGRSEALTRTLWDLQFANTDLSLFAEVKRIVLAEEEWRGEMLNWKKSGEMYWESVSLSFIRNESEDVTHYVVVKEEITERKRIEEKLFESEERFKAFMDNSPAVAWMKDNGGRYIYLNSNYRERFCGADNDWLGKTAFEVWPEELAWALWENDRQVIATGEPLTKVEEMSSIGGYGWWWNFRFPFHDAVGKRYVGGIGIDITEQKRAEEALKQSEELLRKVLETLPVAVWILDREGRVVQANNAAHKIWGGARHVGINEFGEYKGRWLDSGGPITASEWGGARAIRKGETSLEEEVEIEAFDGSRKIILISSVPIRNDKGEVTGAISINQEITDRKRAEQERERLLEEVQHSNQELQQFAYVASHDLQEPLRMISSYLQLLDKKYKGQLDEKAETYIRYAVDGAARMQKLIEGLLAYSRISSGITNQMVDMNLVLAAALANLEQAVQECNGTITITSPLPMVAGDETMLIQLFQNLIANALKYRKTDVSPQVQVAARRQGNQWIFSVTDNGIGIDPQYQESVFQIFKRLHTKEEYPGTGIGLASCKKIVERHDGKIWVESEPGKGSTFHFIIPAQK